MAFFLAWMPLAAQQGKMRRAQKKFDQQNYVRAIEMYRGIADKGYESMELYQNLGDACYYMNDMEGATAAYERYLELQPRVAPVYYYRYAQALQAVNKQEAAREAYLKYSENNPEIRAKLVRNNKYYLDSIEARSGRYQVSNLPLNSAYTDYAPAWWGDGLVFSSARDTGFFAQNRDVRADHYFSDLYVAEEAKVTPSKKVRLFSEHLSTRYHESSAAFSAEGKEVFFTRNRAEGKKLLTNEKGVSTLQLFRARGGSNEDWGIAETLPVNHEDWSSAHPAVSPDGKWLYFASDRPGGMGNSDLYRMALMPEGGYGEPENLGPSINTEGKETFPFIAADGTLYFASDGRPGLGGLDVFRARFHEDGTVTVTNMGRPVNSERDDFSLIIDAEARSGFLASNRSGGKGSDDIYAFDAVKCERTLRGRITDLYEGFPLEGVKVYLKGDGQLIDSVITDKTGRYIFPKADCFFKLSLEANLPKYRSVSVPAETGEVFDLALQPEETRLERDLMNLTDLEAVYFDFDSSRLREEAFEELDRIAAFMQEHEEVKLHIASHTDKRGSAAYNQKLSERRAASTAQYLLEKGIDADRLIAKGYGESQAEARCADSACPREVHQQYRRSEFELILPDTAIRE